MSMFESRFTCWMCGGHRESTIHTLKEMMFGTGEEFVYIECEDCQSLQISDVPSDLSVYYPSTYYSFLQPAQLSRTSRLRRWLRRQRAEGHLSHGSVVQRLLRKFSGDYFGYPWEWFRLTKTRTTSRILDVGCGDGFFLKALQAQGFTSLCGVDPFRSEGYSDESIEIRATTVFDVNGEFDLVCAHHSLEHTPNPRETLSRMRDLTRVGGYVLIRLPVIGEAWRTFGVNWVELDAPRHLFIPTRRAMEQLGKSVGGLRLVHTQSDATFFEFAGSELYRRGIPLYDMLTGRQTRYEDHFDGATLAQFRRDAELLNARAEGGRAAFYFQRTILSG